VVPAIPAFADNLFPKLREDDPVAFPQFIIIIIIDAHSNHTS